MMGDTQNREDNQAVEKFESDQFNCFCKKYCESNHNTPGEPTHAYQASLEQ